jgi:large subunit ribosomal protein L33
MAKKAGGREMIKMKSTESPHVFTTVKNKRNTPDRLQLKRYDPRVRKHVIFKEAR